MAFAAMDGIRLHYEVDGLARTDAPWVVLSNSLGTDLSMWDPQVAALGEHFRVLRYDTRGHGRSDAPRGPYTIEQLSADVIALLDTLNIERTHFCGLSMGGLTGIALGARHAERVDRLVLCNTAAKIGSPEVWNPRIAKAREDGMASLADSVIERWFTAGFREREPASVKPLREQLARSDAEGYAANCEAIRDADLRAELGRITAETLVISGTHDIATTADQGRALAHGIGRARYVELDASHISNIEQRVAFTRTLVDFLTEPA
jgi:3-oxoadipate enol-lactonase